MLNCTYAVIPLQNCLAENNHNPEPANETEICVMGLIQIDCQYSAIAATTCTGKQDAMDAVRRMQLVYESVCVSLGNAATSVFMGLFTVIIFTCVKLLHWSLIIYVYSCISYVS